MMPGPNHSIIPGEPHPDGSCWLVAMAVVLVGFVWLVAAQL